MPTPIRSNQIRSHVNKEGQINFYLTVQTGNDHKGDPIWAVMWFRNSENGEMRPLHLAKSSEYFPSANDPVVMEDLNNILPLLRQQVVKPA